MQIKGGNAEGPYGPASGVSGGGATNKQKQQGKPISLGTAGTVYTSQI